jgi:hypothetical protein
VAIAFAQEGDPRDYDIDAGILTFEANVAPAAQPASLRCSSQLPSRDTGVLSSERSMRHLVEFLSALQPTPWVRCNWPGSSTVTWTGWYRPACLRYRRGQADAAQTLRRAYRVKRPQAVVPALEAKGTSQVRDGPESGLAAPPGA